MRRVTRQVESPKPVKESGTIDFKIPNTVKMLLALSIFLYGGAALTISSGTLVFRQGSFVNSMFSSVTFSKGNAQIKAAPAEFYRMFQGAVEGEFTPLYSVASAALTQYPTNRLAPLSSPPTGTTGQFHNYNETLKIFFEMMYLTDEKARLRTGVDTTGSDEYLLQFHCQELEGAMRGVGNTASITWGDLSDLRIAVELEEMVEDYEGEFAKEDLQERRTFYQISKPVDIRSGMQDHKINNLITSSGQVAGLWFITRDNAAGTATTSTGNQRNDNLITKLEVNIDDQILLARSSWRQLKDRMRRRWKYVQTEVNGVGEDTGVSGLAICDGRSKTLRSLSEKNNLGLVISTNPQATSSDYGSTGVAFLRYMVDYVGLNPAS